MIPVLAYWLFLFFFFLPAGVLFKKILRITFLNLPLTILLGMAFTATAFTAASFIVPLGWPVLLASLVVLGTATVTYWHDIRALLRAFRAEVITIPATRKLLLAAFVIAEALKSAQAPSIIDNESYYIQTIKWLNEYGLVKGLANLHLFLGQASSWHALQAGLNFSFMSERINDLNGFLFTICIAYYMLEQKRRPQMHWIGIMPVFSAIFFLFVDTPSPDLPLMMILPIIFHLYTENAETSANFRSALVLFAFLVLVKVTIAPVAVLFLFWPKIQRHFGFIAVITLPTILIWIGRNAILTGYPLYPLLFVDSGVAWTLPKHIPETVHLISNKTVYDAPAGTPFFERMYRWLVQGGIDGTMNRIAIALFFIAPWFRKIRNDKTYRAIYLTLLIHFIILLYISPQYRFFLPGLLWLSAFIITEIFSYFNEQEGKYTIALTAGFAGAACIVFFPPGVSRTVGKRQGFETSQLFRPEPRSALPNMTFERRTEGRLRYYSPKENFFFYGTADGPLPCVNEKMLQDFKSRFHCYPQLLGNEPGDGFYSAATK